MELTVSRFTPIVFDLPSTRALDLDVCLDSPMHVVWAPFNGEVLFPRGHSPYPLLAGSAHLRIDLSPLAEWRRGSLPMLFVFGTGRFLITGASVQKSPEDPEEFRKLADRATRFVSERLAHTTINFLTPPWWDATRHRWVTDRLALAAICLAGVALLGNCLTSGRVRPARAVIVGVLIAAVGYNAFFLLRLLPALDLVPEPSTEVRIRDNYHLDPAAGALAALARRTLLVEERVGILARPEDWFTPLVLNFNLAPRRCVLLRSDESSTGAEFAEEHTGIGGLEKMRLAELDAIVVSDSDARLPPGFFPVAHINARSYLARRE